LENIDKLSPVMMSRLFIYYNERSLEGTVKQDSGAQLRDGIKTLATNGVCPETDWPYIISKFKSKPNTKSYQDGLQHKITSYSRLTTSTDMKTCLASGFPFVFGFTVYQSFESTQVANTGIVPMPSKNEQVLGGHAVMACGFDDSKNWMIVRNSWGSSWGAAGYFFLPYSYISNTNLATDFWTIRKGNLMLNK
jgi:C1A family cysteine protease